MVFYSDIDSNITTTGEHVPSAYLSSRHILCISFNDFMSSSQSVPTCIMDSPMNM